MGAREHYAVPRALHSRGALLGLFTDVWQPPGLASRMHGRSWRERFHPALDTASVFAANASLLKFELTARLRGLRGWDLMLARNAWFQTQALRFLQSIDSQLKPGASKPTLFSYSYASRELFRVAKARGWRTVLGQIDPGRYEEELVRRLFTSTGTGLGDWSPAPEEYWRSWRDECELADVVVVNSEWSRQGLAAEGVAPDKLRVAPLAFESPDCHATRGFAREYPARFTRDRPMRVLFLGQVNVRKGAGPLMTVMARMQDEPVEFWVVGPVQIEVPAEARSAVNARWIGPVSRQTTAQYYRDADVFLFPTFSDGFGLTQLEAQAWRLPVIASRFCGQVVQDGVNGLVMHDVSVETMAAALRRCLAAPELLATFSRHAISGDAFGLDALAENLLGVVAES